MVPSMDCQLLEHLDKVDCDIVLVIGLKPHPRRLAFAQFACDQYCIAYTGSLPSFATRHGPVDVLIDLLCLPCLGTRSTRT